MTDLLMRGLIVVVIWLCGWIAGWSTAGERHNRATRSRRPRRSP